MKTRFVLNSWRARLVLGIWTGLVASVTAAQSAPDAPRPARDEVKAPAAPTVSTFTLSNGMTLIVKPDRRAPTAVHMVWVRVGSMDEVDGSSGVAHVLEHMMFKGTPTVGPGEFSRRVAALGGRENAFTSLDYTGYYQQIPASALEEVMRLESDRFAHNQWSDDEFRRELEVVKEERRLRTEDNPRALLREALHATAWMASPYRRPIVGWMSDLESLTPDDARAFYQRWYVPANAAVVVAGDVDVQHVRALAERYYGSLPARAVPPRKPRTEPAQAGLRRVYRKAPAEQAVVTLAFKVPSWTGQAQSAATDQDALALTVLAAVLDGYTGARLERALVRTEPRVADQVDAANGLFGRGPQLFTLSAIVAPGRRADEVEQALRAQVARIAQDGVTLAELRRVKNQWIAAEVYQRDSLFNQARELGSYWAQDLPLDTNDRLIAQLDTITPQQVQQVAQRYFGDDALTVAVLQPQPRAAQSSAPRSGVMLRH
ncbi:MAG: pitrilysin family protein [Rhodoferax sp.]